MRRRREKRLSSSSLASSDGDERSELCSSHTSSTPSCSSAASVTGRSLTSSAAAGRSSATPVNIPTPIKEERAAEPRLVHSAVPSRAPVEPCWFRQPQLDAQTHTPAAQPAPPLGSFGNVTAGADDTTADRHAPPAPFFGGRADYAAHFSSSVHTSTLLPLAAPSLEAAVTVIAGGWVATPPDADGAIADVANLYAPPAMPVRGAAPATNPFSKADVGLSDSSSSAPAIQLQRPAAEPPLRQAEPHDAAARPTGRLFSNAELGLSDDSSVASFDPTRLKPSNAHRAPSPPRRQQQQQQQSWDSGHEGSVKAAGLGARGMEAAANAALSDSSVASFNPMQLHHTRAAAALAGPPSTPAAPPSAQRLRQEQPGSAAGPTRLSDYHGGKLAVDAHLMDEIRRANAAARSVAVAAALSSDDADGSSGSKGTADRSIRGTERLSASEVREHWREIDGIRMQASHEVEERACVLV